MKRFKLCRRDFMPTAAMRAAAAAVLARRGLPREFSRSALDRNRKDPRIPVAPSRPQ
jgi:hypothetical protein